MQLSGILEQDGSGGLVRVDFKSPIRQVEVPRQYLNGAPFGFRVVVEVPDTAAEEQRPRGRVIKALGPPELSDVAMEGILAHYGLKENFPDAVLDEIRSLPQDPSQREIDRELSQGRRDLRELKTLTIDGLGAKDLDDALSIEARRGGGYRLYVHIADVSHYVRFDSACDREALERGNSYYLADRVIPMLPPELSNGLCSLTGGRDRFAVTCEIDYDARGKRLGCELYPSLIRSDLRGSYEELAELFPEQKDLRERLIEISDANPKVVQRLGADYEAFLPDIVHLAQLASILRTRRMNEGALNFEFEETALVVDAEGKVLDIHAEQADWTNQLIEECMIAANVAVAERYGQAGAPILYRVHEKPDDEAFEQFKEIARLQGASLGAIRIDDQKSVARAIENIKKLPSSETLMTLLLRSLAKARYDHRPLGHYALAEPWYAHFTAPIRRYSDLVTHRALKLWIRDEMPSAREIKRLPEVAEHVSETERSAINAERDSQDQKICEYMEQFVGEIFDVQISGVIQSGLFVRLPNTVEGMVPFFTMEDYYVYDEHTLSAKGSDHGRHFRIGDKCQVRLTSVNVVRRFIDFVMVNELASGHDGKKKDAVSRAFDASIRRQNEERRKEAQEASKRGGSPSRDRNGRGGGNYSGKKPPRRRPRNRNQAKRGNAKPRGGAKPQGNAKPRGQSQG